eukprot:g15051.t1
MKSISLLDTFKQTFYTNIQDVSIEKKEKELERSSSSSSSQNVNAHDTLTNELTDAIINFDVALNNINKLAEDGIPNEVTIPTKMLKEFDGMYSTSFTVGIVGKLLECKEQKFDVVMWPGDKLHDAMLDAGIDLECACDGEAMCSTCHCIFTSEEVFDELPIAEEEEEDMLDLAMGLTDTSRLSCQIEYQVELDGCEIKLPAETSNYY